jgi:hypothetical protein
VCHKWWGSFRTSVWVKSDELRSENASVKSYRGKNVQGYTFPASLKCEMLDWRMIYLLHMLRQMLEMPMDMNTCISTASERGLYAFQHPRCGLLVPRFDVVLTHVLMPMECTSSICRNMYNKYILPQTSIAHFRDGGTLYPWILSSNILQKHFRTDVLWTFLTRIDALKLSYHLWRII